MTHPATRRLRRSATRTCSHPEQRRAAAGGTSATCRSASVTPGVRAFDELTIEKTAVPTYRRDFDWTIDKSVDSRNGHDRRGHGDVPLHGRRHQGPGRGLGPRRERHDHHREPERSDVRGSTGVTDEIENDPDAADCNLLDPVPATIAGGSGAPDRLHLHVRLRGGRSGDGLQHGHGQLDRPRHRRPR